MKTPTLKDIEKFVLDAGSDDLPTFGGTFEGGIHCQQVPDEIAPCIHAILASKQTVKSYLEIGVAAGGTTYLFHHFFQPELIVLLDDNKHHKAHLRPSVLVDVIRTEIIGESSSEQSVQAVADLKTSFDVMLIDGDHNYPGVKLDTTLYLPFLRPGGFVIYHDSILPAWGVMRVVRELKADPTMDLVGEYVSEKHARPCGVALFRKVK